MNLFSQLSRSSEKQSRNRIVIAIIGSILLLCFVGFFGLQILIGFSILLEKMRGTTKQTTTNEQTFVAPPVLDALPEATNSAGFVISGSGQPNATLILYLNNTEEKKLTISPEGKFEIRGLPLKEGKNTISAKITDDTGSVSDLSNTLDVLIKKTPPTLEVTSPDPNATITGDQASVQVNGKTDEDVTVTINGRFVVMKPDHTFGHIVPLNEGANTVKIIATDKAGNETVIERTVIYQR